MILLFTILNATVGSFIIYLVFTECFGPSEPTKLVDSFIQRCIGVLLENRVGPEMEKAGNTSIQGKV